MGIDIYFNKAISTQEIEEKTEYNILIENNYENFKRKVNEPDMTEEKYLGIFKNEITELRSKNWREIL